MRAITCVPSNRITANSAVLTRCADTVVDVDVTLFARKSGRTDAFETIDHIGANAAVDAWARSAFIDVNFAMNSGISYKDRRRNIVTVINEASS